ncbi:wall-associated receptor kinase-like 9 [Phtheirospermum japonicum]|uniref:Wall-associated receptor kinase-like 9 n=1 Tax=Phtheirospermum japonicum TaxID=374723 RepID=A0A830CNE1_9LAMI|nr:wall-associated receptor kinase-like 9 [Phtheirospermum japonicum]
MTGRKPLSSNTKTDEEKSLSTFFVVSLKEDRLFQIVDPRVLREGSLEQIRGVGELVRRCLRLQSEERPTMKEVAMELEGLRKISKHPWAGQEEVQEEGVGLMSRDQQSDLYESCRRRFFLSAGSCESTRGLDNLRCLFQKVYRVKQGVNRVA